MFRLFDQQPRESLRAFICVHPKHAMRIVVSVFYSILYVFRERFDLIARRFVFYPAIGFRNRPEYAAQHTDFHADRQDTPRGFSEPEGYANQHAELELQITPSGDDVSYPAQNVVAEFVYRKVCFNWRAHGSF